VSLNIRIFAGGCNAIPKTVHLFSTADPVFLGFEDSFIDGYGLCLTPGATVKFVELINEDRFVIINDMRLCFDVFYSISVYSAAQSVMFHEHLGTVKQHLISYVFGFYAGDTYMNFA
jgi:hypothetical protein